MCGWLAALCLEVGAGHDAGPADVRQQLVHGLDELALPVRSTGREVRQLLRLERAARERLPIGGAPRLAPSAGAVAAQTPHRAFGMARLPCRRACALPLPGARPEALRVARADGGAEDRGARGSLEGGGRAPCTFVVCEALLWLELSAALPQLVLDAHISLVVHDQIVRALAAAAAVGPARYIALHHEGYWANTRVQTYVPTQGDIAEAVPPSQAYAQRHKPALAPRRVGPARLLQALVARAVHRVERLKEQPREA